MLKLSLQQIRQLILNSYFNLLWLMVVGGGGKGGMVNGRGGKSLLKFWKGGKLKIKYTIINV